MSSTASAASTASATSVFILGVPGATAEREIVKRLKSYGELVPLEGEGKGEGGLLRFDRAKELVEALFRSRAQADRLAAGLSGRSWSSSDERLMRVTLDRPPFMDKVEAPAAPLGDDETVLARYATALPVWDPTKAFGVTSTTPPLYFQPVPRAEADRRRDDLLRRVVH
jgi:hypothetical protein